MLCMQPIFRLHGYIIPQYNGEFKSSVKNKYMYMGQGQTIYTYQNDIDPTTPKILKGEVHLVHYAEHTRYQHPYFL
jgi:hypothetical protein